LRLDSAFNQIEPQLPGAAWKIATASGVNIISSDFAASTRGHDGRPLRFGSPDLACASL
jgi:hypothetical protein